MALCVLDPLDPVQHLALDGGGPGVDPLEPCEILHADQCRLGTTPGGQHDPLATVGCVVDEHGQAIAGLGQTHLLHASLMRH